MAGLFEAFQRGSNMADAQRRAREAEEIAREERDYQRGRREKVDPLQDRLLEEQVAGAEFAGQTRPLQLRSLQAGVQRQEFAAERDPVLAGQQDQQFGLGMRAGEQQMELARRADGRAAAGLGLQQRADQRAQGAFDVQQAMAALQLDAAQIEKQRKLAERKWLAGKQTVAQLAQSGKPDQAAALLQSMYEEVDDGNPDNGIKFDPQAGWYIADDNGQPVQVIGDMGALMQFVDTYIGTPEVFQQAYVANRAAAAQREQFEAEEAGKNNRAILSALGSALKPSFPGQPAPTADELGPIVGNLRSIVGGSAAPATAQGQGAQKSVVRTGVDPDTGRRVAQYSDGTVGYID